MNDVPLSAFQEAIRATHGTEAELASRERVSETFEGEPPPEIAFVEWVRHGGDRVGLVDAKGWLSLATGLLTKQDGHRGEEACPSGS